LLDLFDGCFHAFKILSQFTLAKIHLQSNRERFFIHENNKLSSFLLA
jgi:hypothetical protein